MRGLRISPSSPVLLPPPSRDGDLPPSIRPSPSTSPLLLLVAAPVVCALIVCPRELTGETGNFADQWGSLLSSLTSAPTTSNPEGPSSCPNAPSSSPSRDPPPLIPPINFFSSPTFLSSAFRFIPLCVTASLPSLTSLSSLAASSSLLKLQSLSLLLLTLLLPSSSTVHPASPSQFTPLPHRWLLPLPPPAPAVFPRTDMAEPPIVFSSPALPDAPQISPLLFPPPSP